MTSRDLNRCCLKPNHWLNRKAWPWKPYSSGVEYHQSRSAGLRTRIHRTYTKHPQQATNLIHITSFDIIRIHFVGGAPIFISKKRFWCFLKINPSTFLPFRVWSLWGFREAPEPMSSSPSSTKEKHMVCSDMVNTSVSSVFFKTSENIELAKQLCKKYIHIYTHKHVVKLWTLAGFTHSHYKNIEVSRTSRDVHSPSLLICRKGLIPNANC